MIKVYSGPAFNIPVSEEEKALAKQVRDSLSLVLKKQDKFFKYLDVFFGNLEKLKSTTGLAKISPIIKQYEHKMKKIFNSYINEFSKSLSAYQKSFSDDSEMDEIRDLIIENVRNMRKSVIELLLLMKDVSEENFPSEALKVYNDLKNVKDKLENLIRDEWFGKIDYDILGQIRLGTLELPLSIKD